MRKTIIVFYSTVIIFFIIFFIILYSLFKPDNPQENFEITFGYNINDSNLAFVDSASAFTKREGLKAQISFPNSIKNDFDATFKVKRQSDGYIVSEQKLKNKAGVSGQLITLSASDWPAGMYECTYESNNETLAEETLILK